MEAGDYFPANVMEAEVAQVMVAVYFSSVKGVDKKDISESADKVEFRIHWVDADHFDLGSTSFSRVKLPK